MRRNQTRHSADRRGLERWNRVPRESSCTSASRCYRPSLPLLRYHSPLFFSCFLLLLVVFHLFIYLPALLHLQLCAAEEATALTRYSGHKEGATEIKRHSYSENISISPKEYQLNWYQMNPTPPRLHFHSSPPPLPRSLFCLPDLSQGVTVSYSLICVNPCFHQHGRRRATSGGPVSPPISATPVHRLRLIARMSEKKLGAGKYGRHRKG